MFASVVGDAQAACPDYDAELAKLAPLISFEDASPFAAAQERVGDAWFCAHANASLDEIDAWLASVPTGPAGSRRLPSVAVGANRVLILWGRQDVSLGGRAVSYARSTGGAWERVGAIQLAGRPAILGRLGDHVVVGEHHDSGSVDRLDVRVLRVTPNTLEETQRASDLWGARVLVSSADRLRIEFQRVPRFAIDGSNRRPAFELTFKKRGLSVSSSERTLTPALALLNKFCGASGDSARHRLVRIRALAERFPACDRLTVTGVRRAGRAEIITVDAGLVCERRGASTALREASVRVERHRGQYKIVGLTAAGCDLVRARVPHEAF